MVSTVHLNIVKENFFVKPVVFVNIDTCVKITLMSNENNKIIFALLLMEGIKAQHKLMHYTTSFIRNTNTYNTL